MTETGDFFSPDDGTGLVSEGVDAPKPSSVWDWPSMTVFQQHRGLREVYRDLALDIKHS